ncbi:MAG: carbohydrate ABC transporter permease [Clostridia bacterium]|nr:carbohydrate ABC transporter permease [Clostridia bacterium]
MRGKIVGKRRKPLQAAEFVIYLFMGLFALVTIYPFWYTVVGSFSDGMDYQGGGVWLFPRIFTTANYSVVFADARLWTAFGTTILRTLAGTFLSLVVTSCTAYGMSRPNLKFRRVLQWLNMFTMFFSGGLIPYVLIINMLGLYNSFWVYVIPSAYSVYNMIIIQNFFKGIPTELHEAAVLDGASEFRIWWNLFIPLSGSVLATVALWCAVGHWNNYMQTMLYTNNPKLITLQYYLMLLIKEANVEFGELGDNITSQVTARTVSFAAIVVASLPILCVYPFVLKHFAGSVMIGSLK